MRNNAYPQINLAPQVLINCHGGGTCDGKHKFFIFTVAVLIIVFSLSFLFCICSVCHLNSDALIG